MKTTHFAKAIVFTIPTTFKIESEAKADTITITVSHIMPEIIGYKDGVLHVRPPAKQIDEIE